MSRRAQDAYNNYKMPRSRWTKSLMLEAIDEEIFLDYWNEEREQIIKAISTMTKKQIWDKFFEYDSYHHTGKFAQVTDFYGVSEYAVVDYGNELLGKEDIDQYCGARNARGPY